MVEITKDINRVNEKIKSRNLLDQNKVIKSVSRIMKDVRDKGDEALRMYTLKFDRCEIKDFKVTEDEFDKAYTLIDKGFLDVLKKAKDNIREYHMKQVTEGFLWQKSEGIVLGQKITPLDIVGIYIPGGTAPLISSVLMNAIPAKVAGVENIIMCTPPGKDGFIDAERLVAARESGVREVYKLGGAQAVFAMAFGTETIPKVDKITGPGNIYVANAKRLSYGYCDIDMIAGPSEIMVIADESADPVLAAADLLSQAEHDCEAGTILCCLSVSFAEKVNLEIKKQLKQLSRKKIIKKSLSDYGIIYVGNDIDQLIECSNIIAPEHLELHVKNPMEHIDEIKNAGAIFLGQYSPESLGDYFAGPNHTLPTGGTARFYSPLGAYDFCKKTSIISYDKDSLSKVSEDIQKFALKEELDAHAKAVAIRFKGDKK